MPHVQHMNFKDARAILSPEAREHIPAPVLDQITSALSSSIAHTFMWSLVPAVLTFLFVFLMTNDRLTVVHTVQQEKSMKRMNTNY